MDNKIVAASEKSDPKTISLVLGSGGARGFAHIGIIRWLEEHNYKIESICGSSIGALVGGIHAMGKLDEFTEWVTAINRMEIIKLLDFSFGQGGLVKGDRIIGTLAKLTGHQLIEDLPIAFTAVASDVANEKEVWISRGPVFEAIRASISMPLIFTPMLRNGVYLMDGGILNPVPIAPTFRDHTDLTIAINLAGPPIKAARLDPPKKPAKSENRSLISRKIDEYISSLSSGDTHIRSASMYEVAYQAVDAMQGAVARQKLAAYPPDLVVELPRNLCGVMEFDRAEELIAYGYRLAEREIRFTEGSLI